LKCLFKIYYVKSFSFELLNLIFDLNKKKKKKKKKKKNNLIIIRNTNEIRGIINFNLNFILLKFYVKKKK